MGCLVLERGLDHSVRARGLVRGGSRRALARPQGASLWPLPCPRVGVCLGWWFSLKTLFLSTVRLRVCGEWSRPLGEAGGAGRAPREAPPGLLLIG